MELGDRVFVLYPETRFGVVVALSYIFTHENGYVLNRIFIQFDEFGDCHWYFPMEVHRD